MRNKKHSEVTVREAAIMLGKRLDDTYKILQAERLKGRKVDGRWLLSVASVEAYKRAGRAHTRRTHRVTATLVAGQMSEAEAATA